MAFGIRRSNALGKVCSGTKMSELAAKLAHRNAVNEGMAEKNMKKISNVYMEFQEFTRKQIKTYEDIFNK